MRDIKSIHTVQLLHPKISGEVKTLIEKAESFFPATIAIRVVQGLRTFSEQDALHALGRTIANPDGKSASKPMGNIVTNARGGQSYHNYGLSLDFCLLYDKDGNGTYEVVSWDIVKDFDKDGIPDWQEVINVFVKAGYESGANWSKIHDAPHIEKTFGHHWSDLLSLYNEKKFIPGTQYVNI